MRIRKMLVSILLSLTMVVSFMPSMAFAFEGEAVPADKEPAAAIETDDTAAVSEASEANDSVSEEAEPVIEPDKFVSAEYQSEPETIKAGDKSSDDLLTGYMAQKVREKTEKKSKKGLRSARDHSGRLDGNSQRVYNVMKNNIQSVSAGQTLNTEFNLSFEDILGEDAVTYEEGIEELQGWIKISKEDLGNEDLQALEYDDFFEDYFVTDEVVEAIKKYIAFDISATLNALLADMPYELYWYDKVNGTASSISLPGVTEDKDNVYLYSPGHDLGMCVSADYSYSGKAGTYILDAERIDSVNTAIETAQGIISNNAGKDNLEKLQAYKTAVCDLTEYDEIAADSGASYGDPWQLISVFDNDPETNVVCEGYSKAYKFLCDLSSWSDGADIACDTVTGNMECKNAEGEGPHMWNILHMEDGRNYMADITNSDEGTVGEAGDLFLTGYKSGSVFEGYSYGCGSNGSCDVYYEYDSDMFDLFDIANLRMSKKDYSSAEPLDDDEVNIWLEPADWSEYYDDYNSRYLFSDGTISFKYFVDAPSGLQYKPVITTGIYDEDNEETPWTKLYPDAASIKDGKITIDGSKINNGLLGGLLGQASPEAVKNGWISFMVEIMPVDKDGNVIENAEALASFRKDLRFREPGEEYAFANVDKMLTGQSRYLWAEYNTYSQEYWCGKDKELSIVNAEVSDEVPAAETEEQEGENPVLTAGADEEGEWYCMANQAGTAKLTLTYKDADGKESQHVYNVTVSDLEYGLTIDTVNSVYTVLPDMSVGLCAQGLYRDYETEQDDEWESIDDSETGYSYSWDIIDDPEDKYDNNGPVFARVGDSADDPVLVFDEEKIPKDKDGTIEETVTVRAVLQEGEGETAKVLAEEELKIQVRDEFAELYYTVPDPDAVNAEDEPEYYPVSEDDELMALGLGESVVRQYQVRKYSYSSDSDPEEYEMLDNVDYRWSFDSYEFLVEAVEGSSDQFILTRKTVYETDVELLAYENEQDDPVVSAEFCFDEGEDVSIDSDNDSYYVYLDGDTVIHYTVEGLGTDWSELFCLDHKLYLTYGIDDEEELKGIPLSSELYEVSEDGNTLTIHGEALADTVDDTENLYIRVDSNLSSQESGETFLTRHSWLSVRDASVYVGLPDKLEQVMGEEASYIISNEFEFARVNNSTYPDPDGAEARAVIENVAITEGGDVVSCKKHEDYNYWELRYGKVAGTATVNVSGKCYIEDADAVPFTQSFRITVLKDRYSLNIISSEGRNDFIWGESVDLQANYVHESSNVNSESGNLKYEWEFSDDSYESESKNGKIRNARIIEDINDLRKVTVRFRDLDKNAYGNYMLTATVSEKVNGEWIERASAEYSLRVRDKCYTIELLTPNPDYDSDKEISADNPEYLPFEGVDPLESKVVIPRVVKNSHGKDPEEIEDVSFEIYPNGPTMEISKITDQTDEVQKFRIRRYSADEASFGVNAYSEYSYIFRTYNLDAVDGFVISFLPGSEEDDTYRFTTDDDSADVKLDISGVADYLNENCKLDINAYGNSYGTIPDISGSGVSTGPGFVRSEPDENGIVTLTFNKEAIQKAGGSITIDAYLYYSPDGDTGSNWTISDSHAYCTIESVDYDAQPVNSDDLYVHDDEQKGIDIDISSFSGKSGRVFDFSLLDDNGQETIVAPSQMSIKIAESADASEADWDDLPADHKIDNSTRTYRVAKVLVDGSKLSAYGEANSISIDSANIGLTVKDGVKVLYNDTPCSISLHRWNEITYDWSDDNSKVTAERDCKADPNHNMTVEVDTVASTSATSCNVDRTVKYTAEFKAPFSTQTKEVLVPAGEHTWGKGEVTTPASCTTDGVMTYTCTVCGDTKTEVIPAGHVWEFKGFTWTEDGGSYTADATYECANNHEHKETVSASATKGEETASTCKAKGSVAYSAAITAEASLDKKAHKENATFELDYASHTLTPHAAKAATCSATGNKAYWTCDVCEKVFSDEGGQNETTIDAMNVAIDPDAHDWEFVDFSWTKMDSGYTAVANYECANNDKHKKTVNAAVTKGTETPSTCKTKGSVAYSAAVTTENSLDKTAHNDSITFELDYAPHTLTPHAAKAATCSATGNKAYWTCDVCEKVFSDEAGENETSIEAVTLNIDPAAHSYGEWEKCDDKQHKRVCAHNADHIEKADHVWDDGSVTTPAICETSGEKTFKCEICGETKTEVIPAGHVWEFKGFTWTENVGGGYTAVANYECTNNHEHKDTVKAVVTKGTETASTCKTKGSASYTASVTTENSLDKTAHNDSKSVELDYASHTLTEHPYTAETKDKPGNTAYWSCDVCDKYFSDAAGTKQITKDSWLITDLRDAKTAAISKLNEIDLNVYDEADRADIQQAIDTAKAAINAAETVDAVNSARDKAIEVRSSKKTAAEKQEARKTEEQNKAASEEKMKSVITVTVNVATVNAAAVSSAITAAGGSPQYVTTVVLGPGVRKIGKNCFSTFKTVKTLEVKTKKLKAKSVKGALKGSGVKTVKVKIGSSKVNKKFVKSYKKIFTKKNAGKKATVK